MRKIYIVMAAIATMMLASCVKEMPENGTDEVKLGENTLAFTMGGSIKSRSVDAPAEISHKTYSIGEPVDGEQFYLQETVTTLDGGYAEAPETRGTPAYTGNVAKIYSSFGAVAYPLAFGPQASPAFKDAPVNYHGPYWVREFDSDPLGDNQLYLFMHMPSDQPGVVPAEEGGPKYTYAYNTTDGYSISFNYTSPIKASEQKDILFAGRTIQKGDFTPAAPVLFYHTLTGVKFSTANHQSAYERGTRTYIKKVEFVNLKGTGTCTVYPIAGKNNDDGEFDSAKETVVKWEDREVVKVDGKPVVYSQTFDPINHQENVYSGHYDYNTPGKTPDDYFPESFYGPDLANKNQLGEHRTTDWNINDGDASLTFWFIPQEITPDVKMIVTFYIKAGEKIGEDIVREIDFGQKLQVGEDKGVEWKAGELRTYVLKAEEVAVTVEDKMLDDGKTKQMVQIRNTGNVPEFIRATVVANWCIYQQEVKQTIEGVETISYEYKTEDEAAAIGAKNLESVAVYGFTDDATDDDGAYIHDYYVDPWDMSVEDPNSSKSYKQITGTYGTFQTATLTENNGEVTATNITEGFPGPGWVKGSDGFYYYKTCIGVDEAATQPLFYTYTVNQVPQVYLLNKALRRYPVDVHLVMDVVVQAILAPGVSNTSQSSSVTAEVCNDAWEKVLGYRPIAE